jgi:hypothetical protein
MSDQNFQKFIEKITELKKSNKFDLSMEEDLSIAIMNLVSLEEHFYFTANKTGSDNYFDLLNETRSMRKELLARMIPEHEGETWCISKHLLATTMRLIEVGTKYWADGKKEDGKKVFQQAYKVYAMFWGLRLKLIDTKGIKKINDNQLNKSDTSPSDKPWELEDIVNKLVDCCHE